MRMIAVIYTVIIHDNASLCRLPYKDTPQASARIKRFDQRNRTVEKSTSLPESPWGNSAHF